MSNLSEVLYGLFLLKTVIYGFGRDAHDQFINALTRPLLIALQVVRTSFEFHLRECMGSSAPPLPLLSTVISFLQIILYRIKTKVSYFMLFSAFGFAIVCSRYNDEDTRIYLCKMTNHLCWRVGRKKCQLAPDSQKLTFPFKRSLQRK